MKGRKLFLINIPFGLCSQKNLSCNSTEGLCSQKPSYRLTGSLVSDTKVTLRVCKLASVSGAPPEYQVPSPQATGAPGAAFGGSLVCDYIARSVVWECGPGAGGQTPGGLVRAPSPGGEVQTTHRACLGSAARPGCTGHVFSVPSGGSWGRRELFEVP